MSLAGERVNEQMDRAGVIDGLLIFAVMKLMGLCAGNKVDLWGLWPGAWLWHSNCGRRSRNWGPKDRLSCVSTFVSGTLVLDTRYCFLFSFSAWCSSLLTLTFSIPPPLPPPLALFLLVSSALWVTTDGRNTPHSSANHFGSQCYKKITPPQKKKSLLHIDARNAVCLTRCSGMFLRVLLLIVLKFMVYIKFYWCCFMCTPWQSLESARAVAEHYGIPAYSLSRSLLFLSAQNLKWPNVLN